MRTKTIAGLIAGLALLTAGCGDDSSAPAATPTTAATSTASDVSAADGSLTTEPARPATEPGTADATGPTEPTEPGTAVPSAIISLNPTATEMLFAIGAGDQVLAVDDFSNYPSEAADKMAGLSGYEPNVEAIAGLEPDLVVTDGTNPDFIGQLDAIGIPHVEIVAAASFDDIYAELEQLGALTGHVGEAAELAGRMRADIDAAIADLPELDEPLTYYHELDNTYYSVTSDTFIGAVYAQIGLVNIADGVGDGSPYPQLNAEYIIDADPDLIFLADSKYYGETADSVAARPGWDAIAAVQHGGVIEMDDDIASRWGPRIVEYLQLAGDAVRDAAAARSAG